MLLCVLLAGCAMHRVRCDGPLQPINLRHTAQGAPVIASPADHAAVTP
jgi:hypothetical protein